MQCMQWPLISASMIIGPSVPSSSSRGGKRISVLGEKLYVIFCLTTRSQGMLSSDHHNCLLIQSKGHRTIPSRFLSTRLKFVVDEQAALLKVREKEIENLKAQRSLREAEATKAICLRAQASELETVKRTLWYETNALKERNAIFKKERDALDVKLEKFQDDQMKIVNDNFDNLHAEFVEMTLHLEEHSTPTFLLPSLAQLVVVLVTILLEGCVGRGPTSVLWKWLFSSPNRIPQGGRGLARSGLFMIAHDEYFRRTQLYSGLTDGANLLVQKNYGLEERTLWGVRVSLFIEERTLWGVRVSLFI
nr:hypothetical protein [Tanacetum cinerariifolium]